jgi:translation initiation factor IF-2
MKVIKVAKELGVGLNTVLEFLHSKGFDIDSKPTAIVSDEMYEALLKEFQSSLAVKEKADKMVIGVRPTIKKEEKPEPPKQELPKPEPPPVIVPEPEPVIESPEIEEVKEVKEEVVEKPTIIGPKVLGKIDLETAGKKKKVEKPEPKEEPVIEEKATEPEPIEPASAEPEVIEPEPEKLQEIEIEVAENKSDVEEVAVKQNISSVPIEEMMRAETPQLKGLKILGKIDTEKFARPSKDKKPEVKPVPKVEVKPGSVEDAEAKKRKRKRKKVTVEEIAKAKGKFDPKAKPAPKEEVKEVTNKEIEEKIKATMARLNLVGKNKRQKIRRDNREKVRERMEAHLESMENQKLQVTEFISVSELASLMNVPVTEVITTCMNLGVIVSINQRLDAEIIGVVASEFGHEIEFIGVEDSLGEIIDEDDDPASLVPRAPIVTVMGHVDHGKTSLLDYIRKANVVAGEAGGITQHIGAYEVVINGKKITFLDTPGHEAFTAMRARGAKVTDVAVVIIAADDNIMPQTREAIAHAQAAGVPIVFAINKIDKAGADPERIKNELAQMNMMVEDWGGKYQSQDISAKSGINIEQLLEKILLEAEILDLKANPDKRAHGVVLEASLEKGRGYVTKILVQSGTLRNGDPILSGENSGRVKAMFNERGKKIKEAGPSTPVLVLGLNGAPQAGETFRVTKDESEAKTQAAKRGQINREQATRARKRISLDEIGRRLALGTFKELNLIVKGDFDGSVEALSDSLIKLSVETIQVNVIHKAVGQIAESDVLLASASDAIIIGFQVRPSSNARKLAEKEGVEIKLYSIIYEAIEEIKMAMEGMLEPTKEEKIIGQIAIKEIFKISKIGTVAGCYVEEGKVFKNSHIRVIRDGIVVYPTKEGANGELSSLKRYKEDVKEVRNGMECGLTVRNFNDIKVGDIVEAYEITEVKQKLA